MIRLVAAVAAIVAGVLLLTEVSMQPTSEERRSLAGIYAVAAVVTVVVFICGRALSTRLKSLGSSLQLIALASVGVAGLAVFLAAQTMFLSVHDRNLVLAALVLGVGLGSALAIAFGRQAGEDLARVSEAAARLARGELSVRAGVDRRDEVGRLAAAFDSMASHLDAADEERAVFLASVGHDLRTPLASLQAMIEAAQDGVVILDDRVLAGMERDVAHLSRLVEDLFLFARTEAGTVELHLEPVDLAELADETAEVLGPIAARRDVTIETGSNSGVTVQADPWALGRVLRNLADNAVRHSPPGGVVLIAVAVEDGRPVVTVSDNGPGFSDDIRAVAFERFRRGDTARTRDGSGAGLGLAIARGLVAAHGGTISIEDGPGGRVRVSL
ncbi:MAG TPA: HAMP domain-containing sensor histidine kinase [Acidimicrobiia bacterium]|nr:HAMP domain-containing sensor histidine kinase [Acidimicrobiia bacterium]